MEASHPMRRDFEGARAPRSICFICTWAYGHFLLKQCDFKPTPNWCLGTFWQRQASAEIQRLGNSGAGPLIRGARSVWRKLLCGFGAWLTTWDPSDVGTWACLKGHACIHDHPCLSIDLTIYLTYLYLCLRVYLSKGLFANLSAISLFTYACTLGKVPT